MVWQSNRAGGATALTRGHGWGPAALVAGKAIELLHRLQETLRRATLHPLILLLPGMPWKCICTAPGKPTLICKANLLPALLLGKVGITCRWRIWLSILNCTRLRLVLEWIAHQTKLRQQVSHLPAMQQMRVTHTWKMLQNSKLILSQGTSASV